MISAKILFIEERLEKFAEDLLIFFNGVPNGRTGFNLGNQFSRSAAESISNIGEYQETESWEDRIHKLGVILKELKEIRIALKLLVYIRYGDFNKRKYLLRECNGLVALIESYIDKGQIEVIK